MLAKSKLIEEEYRAYQGFISTAFSRPSKFFIALQALAPHIPPLFLYWADRLPLKRIQALRAARMSSLQFARKLIRDKRGQEPRTTEDRDILSILSMSILNPLP